MDQAVSEYVGSAAVARLSAQTSLIEAVVTTVPVFQDGGNLTLDNLEMTMVVCRDVTTTIDASGSAA